MHALSAVLLGAATTAVVAGSAAAQERPGAEKALAAELGENPKRDAQILARLRALGARAGHVLPDVMSAASHDDPAWFLELIRTIGELAPFRPPGFEVDTDELARRYIRTWMRLRSHGRQNEVNIAWNRVDARCRFPRGTDMPALTQVARGCAAYRVELALELLAAYGEGARSALPTAIELLAFPDPRIVGTDRTVPVRRRAAEAVLAIDPTCEAAATARAVLSGAPPTRSRAPHVPERTRQQIAQLLVELDGRDRERAVANLKALGKLAVSAMVEALRRPQPYEVRAALIEVLRELGPRAAPAAPALSELLAELPVEHTAPLLSALIRTAPWSHDAISVPAISSSSDWVEIGAGHRMAADREQINRISELTTEMSIGLRIDPSATTGELVELLENKSARLRKRALQLLGWRGPTARDALPTLAAALDGSHPSLQISTWNADGSASVGPADQTQSLQRLAAEAIVRIAPADSELAARARKRLESK